MLSFHMDSRSGLMGQILAPESEPFVLAWLEMLLLKQGYC